MQYREKLTSILISVLLWNTGYYLGASIPHVREWELGHCWRKAHAARPRPSERRAPVQSLAHRLSSRRPSVAVRRCPAIRHHHRSSLPTPPPLLRPPVTTGTPATLLSEVRAPQHCEEGEFHAHAINRRSITTLGSLPKSYLLTWIS